MKRLYVISVNPFPVDRPVISDIDALIRVRYVTKETPQGKQLAITEDDGLRRPVFHHERLFRFFDTEQQALDFLHAKACAAQSHHSKQTALAATAAQNALAKLRG